MSNGTSTDAYAAPVNGTWIDHSGALPAHVKVPVVALDTEFMRRNTFYPRLALVQAACGGDHWLFDPLAYDASPDLRALVTDRVAVMHSAGEDLEALAPLLGAVPMRLFDTQIAAALCGMGAGLGYQKLVAILLGVDIPKDETRSNWLQRPLTNSQLEYAEQDVAYLAALHDELAGRLRQRERLAWHAEDCARLVQRARRHLLRPDPQPQRGFAGAADWPPEAQARLRRALCWREGAARQLDKPRPWILDDSHALALAYEPPRTLHELFERVKGQRALRSAQRSELLTVLRVPATPEELAALAPILPPPSGATKRAADAMRLVVKAVAAQLDLPAGLLGPRRLTDEFAVTGHWPDGLEGWRAGLLQDKLVALLPARAR